MKVLTWNAKVGRPNDEFGDALQQLIRDTEPDVIVLQEAGKYTEVLKKRFGKKWYVYAKSGWDESDMNPVLVWKKGHQKKKYGKGWGTVRTHKTWTGPQGGDHKGRTWTWVHVDEHRIMSYHRCTGGKDQNKDAFVEEYDVTSGWIRKQTVPVIIFGDHNCGPKATHKGSSKKIAQSVDGRVIFDTEEPGIDYVLSKGVRGTTNRLKKDYGSDHHPAVFTLVD